MDDKRASRRFEGPERRFGSNVRFADIHDKSLSSRARISCCARESAWFFLQPVHRLAVEPLGAVPAYNAEPDIHSLYRVVSNRHRRLSECFLPVPKHFEGSLGGVSSVAQSASAGPGRSRWMNLLVLRSGFRPLLFVVLALRTLVHYGPPQGGRLLASGPPRSRPGWHGPSASRCHRSTPDQGSTVAPAWLLRSGPIAGVCSSAWRWACA